MKVQFFFFWSVVGQMCPASGRVHSLECQLFCQFAAHSLDRNVSIFFIYLPTYIYFFTFSKISYIFVRSRNTKFNGLQWDGYSKKCSHFSGPEMFIVRCTVLSIQQDGVTGFKKTFIKIFISQQDFISVKKLKISQLSQIYNIFKQTFLKAGEKMTAL